MRRAGSIGVYNSSTHWKIFQRMLVFCSIFLIVFSGLTIIGLNATAKSSTNNYPEIEYLAIDSVINNNYATKITRKRTLELKEIH